MANDGAGGAAVSGGCVGAVLWRPGVARHGAGAGDAVVFSGVRRIFNLCGRREDRFGRVLFLASGPGGCFAVAGCAERGQGAPFTEAGTADGDGAGTALSRNEAICGGKAVLPQ